MNDEKLIEIINGLKNKRLSDTEITEILLENNFTLEDIKENLHIYNESHGLSEKNYKEEYEKIYGKPFVEEIKEEVIEEKEIPIEEVKIIKKSTRLKKIIMVIIIITMILLIIYIVITFDIIYVVKDFFYNFSFEELEFLIKK